MEQGSVDPGTIADPIEALIELAHPFTHIKPGSPWDALFLMPGGIKHADFGDWMAWHSACLLKPTEAHDVSP